jgi:hypothetical protein
LQDCIDDLVAEQQKVSNHARAAARHQQQQQQWLAKRRMENSARCASTPLVCCAVLCCAVLCSDVLCCAACGWLSRAWRTAPGASSCCRAGLSSAVLRQQSLAQRRM